MKKFSKVLISVLALTLVMAFMPGTAFAAGTAKDKAKVTLSVAAPDAYIVVDEKVEATGDLAETYFPAVAGYEPEGVSYFDVLVASHIAKYGADKVTENLEFGDGGGYAYVGKCYGKTGSMMTIINGAYTDVTSPTVKNNDSVLAGFYKNSDWSDFYAGFEKASYSVEIGKTLSLKVAGNSYGAPATLNAVTVQTVDAKTGAKTDLKTTYKDGTASVTFDKAGVYYIIPSGEGTYAGWSGEATGPIVGGVSKVTVNKKANPMTAKGMTVKLKVKKLKKKAQTVKKAKAFTVKKNQGKVTFKKVKGNKKITVSKAGKVTVKKGLKKGTYKVTVKVTAAGNANYKAKSKNVTLTIKVVK